MPEDPEHGDAELISDEEDESVEDGVVQGRLSALLPRKLFADDAAVKKGLLQVYVRVKPVARKLSRCMAIERDALVRATWKNKEAIYKFSKVFPEDAPQEALYAGVARPMVSDLLSGKTPEGVIMAYGVTSAGKTFTMQGTQERPGLVPQALEHLFKELPAAAAKAAGGDCGGKGEGPLRVVVSAYEIYNEVIYDLLGLAQAPIAPGGAARPALRLKEVKKGHITVQGATEAEVTSAKQALDLLRRAARARQSAGTALNQHSSRSHAVFTVKLLRSGAGAAADEDGASATGAAAGSGQRGGGSQRGGGGGGGEKGANGGDSEKGSDGSAANESAGYLHFVDLAGCERVARTGNSGARLRESVAINSSLSTLSRCLEVLRYNQMHPADTKVIPYRESKITHMFREVLSGHGRFCLLVNVSPAEEEFNETKRVLEYAALASKIKMTSNLLDKPTASSAAAAAATAAAHQQGAEAAALAAQVASLTARLAASDARIEELLDDVADLRYDLDVADRKVELLREELVRAEVEKESLEAEVRAELMADVAALVKDAGAKAKEEAARAKEEAARAKEELAKARSEAAAVARDAGTKGRQEVVKAREEAAAARAAAAEAGQEVQRLAAEVAKLQQQLDEERQEAERQRNAAQQAQHEAQQLRAQVGALQAGREPIQAAAKEEEDGGKRAAGASAPQQQQPQQRRHGRQRGGKQQHSRGQEQEEVVAVCPAQVENAAQQQQVQEQQRPESEQQTSEQQQQQQEPVAQSGETKAADRRRKKASDGGRAGRSSAGDVAGAGAENAAGPAARTHHAAPPAEHAAGDAAASGRSPENDAPAVVGAQGGSNEAKAHNKARQGRKVRIAQDAAGEEAAAAAAAAPSTAVADAAAAPGGSGPKRRGGRNAHAAAPTRAGSEEGGAAESEQWRPAEEALRELTASEQQRFASEAPRAVGRRATIAAVAGRPVVAQKGGGGSAEGAAAAGCGGGRKRRCSWGAEEVATAAAAAVPEGTVVGATPVARRTRGGRHPNSKS